MSGVEQADLSNREYSPAAIYANHLAAEQSLNDAWRNVCVLL